MVNQACSAQPTYLVQIRVLQVDEDVITRTLQIPGQITFDKLHNAIIAAFNWPIITEMHSNWKFCVLQPGADPEQFYEDEDEAAMTIESRCDGASHVPWDFGEDTKISDIFEAYWFKRRSVVYIPEKNGATFGLWVLGYMPGNGTGKIQYVAGLDVNEKNQLHTLDHMEIRKSVGMVKRKRELEKEVTEGKCRGCPECKERAKANSAKAAENDPDGLYDVTDDEKVF